MQANPEMQHGWVKVGEVRFRPDRVSYYEQETSLTTKALISGAMVLLELTAEQMDEIMAKATHVIIGERV